MYWKKLFVFLLLFQVACSSISRTPVSATDLQDPQVPGIEGARYWADVAPTNISTLLETSLRQRQASGVTSDYTLTLSGGGEDGAFAAGILSAWSEAGTRPEFMAVTGVSTGALAAPFAFLGSDYDDELKNLYGGLPPSRIFKGRFITGILSGASVKSSDPLRQLIESYVTDDFLAKVANEHRRGRRLLVQSVSLDAQRPVLWDLGAIANSGAPNAKKVFVDVLLASAAIPGVFPPVLIDVETQDGVRDELHVDGGVYSQTAYVPGWDIPRKYARGGKLYAIRNGKVEPELRVIKPGVFQVSARSLSTLIKAQGVDDLTIAYKLSLQRRAEYQATWIGTDFDYPLAEPFDPDYMRALFDYGYQRFKSGALWSNRPPK
ncbi:patatin-like phospholipase family protein [Ruegeria sp. HKCCA4008]|uniref:patatin-like phospholipase family protein n=1 Tax=Ruegeria sp. HKCCA4008 TaxID=2682999 RepID=UPI001487FA9E|nr:patatin-like phospholipase family protein [Ruegeria sp. HKCCA4008]